MREGNYTFIAVAYGGAAEIVPFEQSKTFWIYCLDGKHIKKRQLLSLYAETGSAQLEEFCSSVIDVVICRNFSSRAIAKLKEKGMRLYTFDGGCDAAVKKYLNRELKEL